MLNEGLETLGRQKYPNKDKDFDHGNNIFQGCGLEKIVIPSSLKFIGCAIFRDCRALHTVLFREGSKLETLESRCFKNTALREITIPSRVVHICEEVFCDTPLRTVSFQEGSELQTLGDGCFEQTEMEEISIPSNVARIGPCAFQSCRNLRHVLFEETSMLEALDDSCFCDSGLEEFQAPPGLKEINYSAF